MTSHQRRLVDLDEQPDLEYEDIEAHQRWTLDVDEDGDLVFDDHTKKLATIHGEDAVTQSLLVAVGTTKGEDPVDERFGLDIFEATGRFRNLEREVRKTLLYDDYRHDRVESINDIQIRQVGRGREAHVVADIQIDTGQIQRLFFNLGMV